MTPAPWVAAAVLAATFGFGTDAHAGLASDVDIVAAHLREHGTVRVLAPRYYPGGAAVPLPLPAFAVSDASPGCTRIAVLGSVSSSFALRISGDAAPDAPGGEDLFPSVAGLVEIARCGADREAFSELSLELHSPHAVIETIVATSREVLPSVRALLPRRDLGVVPVLPRPGPPPFPGPWAARADAAERRLRDESGAQVERRLLATDRSGSGRTLFDLTPGCHLIAALALPADASDVSVHDIDAELRFTSGEEAAADRADSPDARLPACNGQRAFAVLSFAGSAPGVPVLALTARRDLPPGLPESWGPEPRARMAKAFLEEKMPSVSAPPIFERLGAGSISALSIETLAGECYLAAVAPLKEDAALVSLAATTGSVRAASHTDDPSAAAAIAFCASVAERATLAIDVRGTGSPLWVAAVWTLGRRRLGENPL